MFNLFTIPINFWPLKQIYMFDMNESVKTENTEIYTKQPIKQDKVTRKIQQVGHK